MVTRGSLQTLSQKGKKSIKPLASGPVFDDNHKRFTTTTSSVVSQLLGLGPIASDNHGMIISYNTCSKPQLATWVLKGMFPSGLMPLCTTDEWAFEAFTKKLVPGNAFRYASWQ